jgi:hypothetical protein
MDERGPFNPGDEGSNPSDPTILPSSNRQDTRPITEESGFKSTGEDHIRCYRCGILFDETIPRERMSWIIGSPYQAWACSSCDKAGTICGKCCVCGARRRLGGHK